MSHQPEFTWDETSGICGCSIFIDDLLHGFGMAECADEDRDVISEKTGMHIAELRAQINLLQNYKKYELYPGLKALEHLKSTMVNSKKHNSESYEAKRLNVEIKNFKKDIADINEAIEVAKQNLYEYINIREKMNKRVREYTPKPFGSEDTERMEHAVDFYNKVLKNDSKT